VKTVNHSRGLFYDRLLTGAADKIKGYKMENIGKVITYYNLYK